MSATAYCACGCGQQTRPAAHTDKSRNYKRGEPYRFVRGHGAHTTRLSHTSDYKKDYALRRNYGLTKRDYDALLASQNGVCAICGLTSTRLCVDHDHLSGKVRALLCNTCNARLGGIENEDFYVRALAYLKEHE